MCNSPILAQTVGCEPTWLAVELISSQVHQGIRLISLYFALRWNVCFLFLRLFLIF